MSFGSRTRASREEAIGLPDGRPLGGSWRLTGALLRCLEPGTGGPRRPSIQRSPPSEEMWRSITCPGSGVEPSPWWSRCSSGRAPAYSRPTGWTEQRPRAAMGIRHRRSRRAPPVRRRPRFPRRFPGRTRESRARPVGWPTRSQRRRSRCVRRSMPGSTARVPPRRPRATSGCSPSISSGSTGP